MTRLDLTRWLLKVRDALAEQDKIKRNSMLCAADRFLKRSNQRALVFRGTRIGGAGTGRNLGQLVEPKQGFESDARN
jgi:hypothetical protein